MKPGSDLEARAREARNLMIEKLCGYDEGLVDYVLNENLDSYDTVPAEVIREAARRVCVNQVWPLTHSFLFVKNH